MAITVMGRFTPPAAVLLACFAALTTLRSAAAGAQEIPFRFVDGFITMEAQVEGRGRRLNMLLDSGASVSVLRNRTAGRLGLHLGERQRVRGVASEATAFSLDAVRANSHGVDLGEFPLAADLAVTDQLCRDSIDGLIGATFFLGRTIQIDFVARRIRLLDGVEKNVRDISMPIKVQNGVLCAQASVNGCRPRWTRLDTGCNEPLHWVVPRSIARGRGVASIGFISRPEDVALVMVSLGSRSFPGTEVVLHGRELFPGESGLLGMGLLSRFRAVTIDCPNQVLLLQNGGQR
jgi:Aspartyl protease